MKIYGDIQSGNCYKIKLLTALLDLNHKWIAIDVLNNETQTPDFLARNPNGKIPLLELEDGLCLWESNAILNFLARDSELLPTDSFLQAKIQQWQFFEQYSHEPYIAVARFINKYLGMPEDRRDEFESKQEGGHKALKVMEQQLSQTPFLVGEQLTTADLSLFGYTHVAHEGGFDLSEYPEIQNWIERIRSLPGFVAMSSDC
ncbi:glutathione S-transferase family protein [Endozoicomonas sp. ALC020]|uniref:glutathione S-transferase family protein n=1 Tax=unclassified Endozoicomonas TaxID=2644528 RepID=UPI003BAF51F5